MLFSRRARLCYVIFDGVWPIFYRGNAKMKTIKKWYKQLPDGYRERALENLDPIRTKVKVESLHKAIQAGFYWNGNKEGLAFWVKVYDFYRGLERLPPLPPLPEEMQK
jgi:hypothetical protein